MAVTRTVQLKLSEIKNTKKNVEVVSMTKVPTAIIPFPFGMDQNHQNVLERSSPTWTSL